MIMIEIFTKGLQLHKHMKDLHEGEKLTETQMIYIDEYFCNCGE